jgi:hypothetical protein
MNWQDRVVEVVSQRWCSVDQVHRAMPDLTRAQVVKALLNAYGQRRIVAKKRTTPGIRGCTAVYAAGAVAETEPPQASPFPPSKEPPRGQLWRYARVASVWDLASRVNESARRAA